MPESELSNPITVINIIDTDGKSKMQNDVAELQFRHT